MEGILISLAIEVAAGVAFIIALAMYCNLPTWLQYVILGAWIVWWQPSLPTIVAIAAVSIGIALWENEKSEKRKSR